MERGKNKRIGAGAKHVLAEQWKDSKTPVCASLVEYYMQPWYTTKQIPGELLNKANKEVKTLIQRAETSAREHTPANFSQTTIAPKKHQDGKLPSLQTVYGSSSPIHALPKQNKDMSTKGDTTQYETEQQTTQTPLSKTEIDHLIAEAVQSKDEYIAQLETDKTKLENSKTAQDKNMEKLRETFERTCVERDELKRRLSEVAGGKLKEGNPNITDLSDPNRPTNIGVRFTELYDNEWTDAFESLKQLDKTDEEVVRLLSDIVQKSYGYCADQLFLQHLFIRDMLLCPDVDDKESAARFVKTLSRKQREYRKHKEFILLKDGRRECAKEAAAHLAKAFAHKEIDTILQEYGLQLDLKKLPEYLMRFGEKCVELSWYMVICDPPVTMSSCDIGTKFDDNLLKPYTRKPKGRDEVVVMNVWPMLLLYPGGPLLAKGVAQPGKLEKETTAF